MDRAEFLEILREQLTGQMHEEKIAAHMRYYEDYIQSQVRSGKTEEEVLRELGDPRLIAKTLLDTDDSADGEIYEERAYYGTSYNSGDEQEQAGRTRPHFIDLSTWYGKLLVILMAGLVIFLLVTILTALLPFLLIFVLVLFILSRLRRR